MEHIPEPFTTRKEDPTEEILLEVPDNETTRKRPVRLLTYWNGTRDVHFPYGGCTREIIAHIAELLARRGLALRDREGDAWPTGIYFPVGPAPAY